MCPVAVTMCKGIPREAQVRAQWPSVSLHRTHQPGPSDCNFHQMTHEKICPQKPLVGEILNEKPEEGACFFFLNDGNRLT